MSWGGIIYSEFKGNNYIYIYIYGFTLVILMETNIYEIKSSDLLQFEIRRPEYEFKSGPLFCS